MYFEVRGRWGVVLVGWRSLKKKMPCRSAQHLVFFRRPSPPPPGIMLYRPSSLRKSLFALSIRCRFFSCGRFPVFFHFNFFLFFSFFFSPCFCLFPLITRPRPLAQLCVDLGTWAVSICPQRTSLVGTSVLANCVKVPPFLGGVVGCISV